MWPGSTSVKKMVLLDGATFKMFFLLLEAALRLLTWSTQATNRPPSTFRSQEDPGAPPNESGPGRKSGATGKRGKSSRKARFFMGGHVFLKA